MTSFEPDDLARDSKLTPSQMIEELIMQFFPTATVVETQSGTLCTICEWEELTINGEWFPGEDDSTDYFVCGFCFAKICPEDEQVDF